MSSAASHGEAYLDIVWRQFRRNRAAFVSLWLLLPLFLLAIFAPVIASNVPFVFDAGDETLYPWFRSLFNTQVVVDYAFNMALVAFPAWVVLAIATNVLGKRRNWPGRRRLAIIVAEYAVLITLLITIFSHPFNDLLEEIGLPRIRPTNLYGARTFPEEEFRSPETKKGYFPPIPFGPTEQDLDAISQPPLSRVPENLWQESNDGFLHILGTDNTGQDVLVRMIYGTRVSLTVGFLAVGLYVTIGIVMGALAGYFGGIVDIIISRIIEVVLLFPSFFLILTLVAMFGPSIYLIMIVIGITGWPTVARLIRGEVLRQRAVDYTSAARALGCSNTRIIFRHILPNALSPALVSAPFGVANAIVTEAGLSLLGYGVRPPAPTWGVLLQQGRENYNYWWLIVVPSIAIFICVSIFNLVGSGLRDAMDPKLRV